MLFGVLRISDTRPNVAADKSPENRNIHFDAQKEGGYCHHSHEGAQGNDNMINVMARFNSTQ